MTEPVDLNKKETSFCVLPGVWLCFTDSPDRMGRELLERGGDLLVLHYCHEGRALLENTKEHTGLAGGEVWIVPREQETGSAVRQSRHYRGLSLLLDPAHMEEAEGVLTAILGTAPDLTALAESLRQNRGEVLPASDGMSRVFEELFLKRPPCEEVYYRLKAMELLLYLSAWGSEKPREEQSYLERELAERAEQVRTFLTDHPDCRLTQAQLAKRFHVSLTALKHAFKRLYGLTLYAYVRQQRLSAAKRLLLETELPVSEIAHRVGYESHSQFTAVFRACEGQTPTEYRKKQQGGSKQ